MVSSAADCRLMLFDTVDSAKKIWIKGHLFSIRELLDAKRAVDGSQPTQDGEGGTLPESSTLAIFRLAPADYHRYNHPVGPAKVLSRKHAGKAYYTVKLVSAVVRAAGVTRPERLTAALLRQSLTPVLMLSTKTLTSLLGTRAILQCWSGLAHAVAELFLLPLYLSAPSS